MKRTFTGFLFFISWLPFLFMGCQANPYRQGNELFKLNCGTCHMDDASGLVKLIPAIDSSKYFTGPPVDLVCLIRNGLPKNEETGQKMPENTKLNDVELANLVNYIRQEYAGITKAVTTEEVNAFLEVCKGHIQTK